MKKALYSVAILTVLSLTTSSFNTINKPLLPTFLKVTVLDHLGNIVEGATVTLYASEEDYFEEKKPVREGEKTDKKGRVTFKKLDPIQYYIHAKKGKKDNVGEGVSTSKLIEGKINLVNTIIKE